MNRFKSNHDIVGGGVHPISPMLFRAKFLPTHDSVRRLVGKCCRFVTDANPNIAAKTMDKVVTEYNKSFFSFDSLILVNKI
jgi:hypothetical protein